MKTGSRGWAQKTGQMFIFCAGAPRRGEERVAGVIALRPRGCLAKPELTHLKRVRGKDCMGPKGKLGCSTVWGAAERCP